MNFRQYSTHKALESLNVELTSKCALKCLRCARTLHKGTYKITELPLDLIKRKLQKDILKDLSFVDLSGNYGDPIYHKHFLAILKYLKLHSCPVYIETNDLEIYCFQTQPTPNRKGSKAFKTSWYISFYTC